MKKTILVSLLVLSLPLVSPAQNTPPSAPKPPAATPAPPPLDWKTLTKYHADNVKALAGPADQRRIVFMGDSITDGWRGAAFFPGKNYLNRGISGQTAAQMVLRFREDVIRLHPKVVIILAGTNDIAQNQGPVPLEAIEDDYQTMVDLARANGIEPILCSILPAAEYPWRKGLDPAHKIPMVNAWLEAYCAKHQVIYCDYFPVLAGPDNGMKPGLSGDGVHPTAAGYALMSPLAEKAIAKALAR